jgi:hypothetical protein
VYKRIGPDWIRRYEFNAAIAGDNPPDPDDVHVQSPELFTYNNRLWIVFVSSNEPDFVTATRGNIRITRVEPDTVPDDNIYKRLNVDTPAKRTEPEVHYLTNESAAIFYARQAENPDPDGCPVTVPLMNKLYRARTLLPSSE